MKPREDFSLIKVILWDIDGTLLNFKMSERYAIDYCFNKFHMGTCTDEMLQRYSVITAVTGSGWRRESLRENR